MRNIYSTSINTGSVSTHPLSKGGPCFLREANTGSLYPEEPGMDELKYSKCNLMAISRVPFEALMIRTLS